MAQTASQGIFGYTYTDDVYDQAVVGWYGRRMGWNVDTRWMVKTPGVMFGIAAAIRALTKPGDGVMICQPVYHPFANVISANNRKPVISELRLARGRYEMDFWDIARKIENRKVKLLVLHSPQPFTWTKRCRICTCASRPSRKTVGFRQKAFSATRILLANGRTGSTPV